jgi:mRNA-degrading endonuclease RelE of RelBE toxin-antitoxin system
MEKFEPFFTIQFSRTYSKLSVVLKERVDKAIRKLCKNPELGKPLRYALKGVRRIHIGPFVLMYTIDKKTKELFS